MSALRRDGPHVDALLAVLFAIGGIVDVATIDDRVGPLWGNVVVMLALAVLVGFRRRAPRVTCYGFGLLLAVGAFLVTPAPGTVPALLGLLLFPYTAGAQLRGWWSYLYVPMVFVVVCIVDSQWHDVQLGDYVFPTALALGAYAAGRNVVHRSALAVELHEANLRSGEERDAEARAAVAAERRRIAHEMHDVVAHSISVMVVQAGGARRILDRDAARAQDAAAQIERTGRETLLEMRRLLGVMRDPSTAAELEPSPTLDGLGELAARARAAGLAVDLDVGGEPRALRPGLELAAYRVVEQALEDALRGRAGTAASIAVRWSPAALEITVTDHRPDVPFAVGAGPSLIGVRERVALFGGELRTGHRPDGGHEVHVRFPLDDAPGTTPPDSDPVPAQGAA